MSTTNLEQTFQSFLDDEVAKGVAPGFQCVVFNRDEFLFNGVSGLSTIPSEEHPQGILWRHDTRSWMASSSKPSISIVVLHIIERGLTKTGFCLSDLDDHEALVKVLPEFKHGSGSLVTKVIEGFEDELGPDGRKVMKLRESRNKVTLRQLLTHTAGIGYEWNSRLIGELYKPSDGSIPNKPPTPSGTWDPELPLVAEPGTTFTYGQAVEWLALFAVRATGQGIRELVQQILFEPLGVPPSEADLWWPPNTPLADAHIRSPPNTGFVKLPPFRKPPAVWDSSEEGSMKYSSSITGSCQAYAKVMQAMVRKDERILSGEMWERAVRDDLGDRGVRMPEWVWRDANQVISKDIQTYARSTAETGGSGVNLLQSQIATAPTLSGRPAGSFAWGGLCNTYFFIDPINGVGSIFTTQMLPFYEPRIVDMRDRLEKLIYQTVVAGGGS